MDELLAAALPRIVHRALAADHPDLADLASLALQLAPQPGLAAPLAGEMPGYSVRLAALAATLTSQQVTQYRVDALNGEQAAASRLARSLNILSVRLGDLGRREEALTAIRGSRHPLPGAGRGPPGRVRPDLAGSLHKLALSLAGLGRREEALTAAEEAAESTGSWPRLARRRSGPTWPPR